MPSSSELPKEPYSPDFNYKIPEDSKLINLADLAAREAPRAQLKILKSWENTPVNLGWVEMVLINKNKDKPEADPDYRMILALTDPSKQILSYDLGINFQLINTFRDTVNKTAPQIADMDFKTEWDRMNFLEEDLGRALSEVIEEQKQNEEAA